MHDPTLYDPIILLITAAILVETSVLLFRKKPSFRGERMILVDTSVLIDGRILDIAEAGFVPGRLVIPRSVLGELQLLADGSDHEKRARARNGLEVITKLQAIPTLNLEIYRDQSDAREGVDNRLLALGGRLGYELCTVDYNLQKVAQAEGITTLSINELSQKLRTLYLPGEKIELLLKQKGQEKGQAIGYASDGTMVVVDNADKLLDQTVSVEVIRSLQTNSGKMMFGKLVKDAQSRDTRQSNQQGQGKRRDGNDGSRAGRFFNRGQKQSPAQTEAVRETTQPPAAPQERPRNNRAQTSVKPAQQDRADRRPRSTQQNQTDQNAQSSVRPERPASRGRRGSRNQSPEDELLNLVNDQDR